MEEDINDEKILLSTWKCSLSTQLVHKNMYFQNSEK